MVDINFQLSLFLIKISIFNTSMLSHHPDFIDEMGSLRRHAISTSPPSKSSPPTIVHCSAGVGRTGVTILMELLVTAIQQNERISIRRFLSHIRSQRMALVQTPGQYKFVYQAILSFLQRSKSNRLI
jgi:tyrosine-protein phosphatase non-receptor type 14/21